MSNVCAWCDRSFEPRRGGKEQRFCVTAHRRAYERAAREWVRRALDAGTLTMADLRKVLDGAPAVPSPAPAPSRGTADTARPASLGADAMAPLRNAAAAR